MPDIKPVQKPSSRSIRSTVRPIQVSTATDLPDFGGATMLPRKQHTGNQFMRGLVVVLVLALIAGYAGYAVSKPKAGSTQKFHAVFLNSGQVYFGTIQSEDEQNVVLSNVFYIQTVDQQLPPETEGDAPRTVPQQQLVMKGDEPYAPSNTIRINRSQIVVVEDLTEQSQILQQIRARLSVKK